MRRPGLLALLLAASALLAGAVELHGRPLRGLSPVPIAELAAHPEKYRGRAVRISGEARDGAGPGIVLAEGSATIPLETDGSFALSANLRGAKVTAEGTLRADPLRFAASGLEIRR